MAKKILPLNAIINLYRLTTFMYVIMGILFVMVIKKDTYFDYSGNDQISSNSDGPRMSIWMWYIGIFFSLIAYNKDINQLKAGKYAVLPIVMILYLIFHILCIFFTTLVTSVAIRVEWIKWLQLGIVTLFILLYSKLVDVKSNVNK